MSVGQIELKVLNVQSRASTYDVVARIEALAFDGTAFTHSLIVPAASHDGLVIPLEPGTYNVQIFLPTGRILQQAAIVHEGMTASLTFREPSPGAAGFSLQEALGSRSSTDLLDAALQDRRLSSAKAVAGPIAKNQKAQRNAGSGANAPTYPLPGRTAAERHRQRGGLEQSPYGRGQVGKNAFMSPVQMQGGSSLKARGQRPRTKAAVPEPSTLALAPSGVWEGKVAWSLLASAQPTAQAERLHWRKMPPSRTRDDAAIWRVPAGLAGTAEHYGARVWGIVRLNGGCEVISLPGPWRCAGTDSFSDIHILIDAAARGRASSSMAVRDEALDGLLSYLDRGRLAPMRTMLPALHETGVINQTIDEKRSNALAACAAAYVGLAVADTEIAQPWDHWLPNIMNWFPRLADGAVVHARRMMLRPNGQDRSEDIIAALERAVEAGIPYYSVGLQLMREMLEMLAPGHARARDLLELVAPVVARCDQKQMFTVLRYPEVRA